MTNLLIRYIKPLGQKIFLISASKESTSKFLEKMQETHILKDGMGILLIRDAALAQNILGDLSIWE